MTSRHAQPLQPELESYARLEMLFRRPVDLPALPAALHQVMAMIDQGNPSIADLEKVIAADPGVALRFLKTIRLLGGEPAASLHHALMKSGIERIRQFAVTCIVQGLAQELGVANRFDPQRFARHSFFVGLLLMLSERRQVARPGGLGAHELLTYGVLHDLAAALLARMAPQAFESVAEYGSRCGVTLDVAFFCLYGRSFQHLGAVAVEAFGLGNALCDVLRHFEDPNPGDRPGSREKLRLANALADESGFQLETWPVVAVMPSEVEAALGQSAHHLRLQIDEAGAMTNDMMLILQAA